MVLIKCSGKAIFYGQNSTFATIYENMLNKIMNQNLVVPSQIQLLIDELYTACQGFGTDIAPYLKSYPDTNYFAQLVKDAIEKAEHDFPALRDDTKTAMWGLYEGILEHAKELSQK